VFAALLLSILTNRTLLWKYYDPDACRQFHGTAGHDMNNMHCEEQNTKSECDEVLHIRNWLPSFDDWNETLRLVPVNGSDVKTRAPVRMNNRRIPRRRRVLRNYVPTLPRLLRDSMNEYQHHRIIFFYPTVFNDDYYQRLRDGTIALPNSDFALDAAKDLYAFGRPFAYGAAFHSLFRFNRAFVASSTSVALLTSPSESSNNDTTTGDTGILTSEDSSLTRLFSIVLHSRHDGLNEFDCEVERDLDCLRLVLPNRTKDNKHSDDSARSAFACRIFVMSDRECTVPVLQPLLLERLGTTCEIVQTDYGRSMVRTNSSVQDHGPHPGAGFFQDVVTALQVTQRKEVTARYAALPSSHYSAWFMNGYYHASVGTMEIRKASEGILRSSSMLVVALIEYQRKLQLWMTTEQQQERIG